MNIYYPAVKEDQYILHYDLTPFPILLIVVYSFLEQTGLVNMADIANFPLCCPLCTSMIFLTIISKLYLTLKPLLADAIVISALHSLENLSTASWSTSTTPSLFVPIPTTIIHSLLFLPKGRPTSVCGPS